MSVFLLKNVHITDSTSDWNGKQADIRIEDGKIKKIGKDLQGEGAKVIEADGLHVSPGWLDMGVQVCDPGLEHREDLRSAAAAAMKGGFTRIACQPNTEPALHSKSELLYLKNEAADFPVQCLPIAAVSRHCRGNDITEMFDLHRAGAVAFSNGSNPISDSGLMLRALQYVKAFDSLVINFPYDHSLIIDAHMHEGPVSTSLGMKGIPSLAEELMVQRDLRLLKYTDSRLHLANISCLRSVELIREAKASGARVTASVPILNLIYTHEALSDYNSNLKVLPPLRTEVDRQALLEGLRDGTIDAISANHVPWDEESKKKEFPFAEFGATGLETLYGLYQTHLSDDLPLMIFVEKCSHGPRRALQQPPLGIAEGQSAELTLFQPHEHWTYNPREVASKSLNSPVLGEELQGKVAGVIARGLIYSSDD